MFAHLSASVLVALLAAAEAASPGYGGYGGYGAHSYKHSHPSKSVHNTTSEASGTSNGAIPATSSSVILSTDVASVPLVSSSVVATVPLSTGVSSGSESAPIPASTESIPYPITSEIPGVSSSLGNSPIGTGISSVPNGPIGTGTGSGSGVTSAPGPEQTEDTTLTYTLGTGSSTTIVTTTIKHTSTETNIEVCCYANAMAWTLLISLSRPSTLQRTLRLGVSSLPVEPVNLQPPLNKPQPSPGSSPCSLSPASLAS